jgi:hypothetical protein
VDQVGFLEKGENLCGRVKSGEIHIRMSGPCPLFVTIRVMKCDMCGDEFDNQEMKPGRKALCPECATWKKLKLSLAIGLICAVVLAIMCAAGPWLFGIHGGVELPPSLPRFH